MGLFRMGHRDNLGHGVFLGRHGNTHIVSVVVSHEGAIFITVFLGFTCVVCVYVIVELARYQTAEPIHRSSFVVSSAQLNGDLCKLAFVLPIRQYSTW